MKPAGLALLLLVALVGCTPSKDIAPETPAKTEVTTKPEPAKPSPPVTATAPDASINPDRAFQLKDLAKRTIKINGKPIELWLMDSGDKRTEGMMFLTDKEVRDDQGMIFIHPGISQKGEAYWMHNTILPLDIIYISPDKKVLNIQKGMPQNDKQLPAAAPFLYVIELKQGQAEKLGVKPGMKVDLPNDLAAQD